MGLYNFQSRFVPAILSGKKTQTIRGLRNYPDAAGSMLHLYTGLRHPGARLLKRVKCTRVQRIEISEKHVVRIDGQTLSDESCATLAQNDGFWSFREMMQFWSGRLPFAGQIIHWGES